LSPDWAGAGTGEAALLALAFALDAVVGEPWTPLHPVVWMGKAIAPLKRRPPAGPARESLVGALYTALVTLGFSTAAWLGLRVLTGAPLCRAAFEVYVLFGCFALRGLVRAGEQLRRALAAHDLAQARARLTSLCSRDPSQLEASELAGAAIESLSENSSDSVVAPLFYFVVFGLPGVVFYRAANTLDAMVGYRGRYEYLGKFAARLDDLLNLVPARITVLLMTVAAACLGLPVARGLRVWWRDRTRTESPNAGQPMALAAGLLGVRLTKRDAYALGAELPLPDAQALLRAERLTRITGWLAALAALASLLGSGGRHVW
jgi:adenosylcobinamide-phosphate synthase